MDTYDNSHEQYEDDWVESNDYEDSYRPPCMCHYSSAHHHHSSKNEEDEYSSTFDFASSLKPGFLLSASSSSSFPAKPASKAEASSGTASSATELSESKQETSFKRGFLLPKPALKTSANGSHGASRQGGRGKGRSAAGEGKRNKPGATRGSDEEDLPPMTDEDDTGPPSLSGGESDDMPSLSGGEESDLPPMTDEESDGRPSGTDGGDNDLPPMTEGEDEMDSSSAESDDSDEVEVLSKSESWRSPSGREGISLQEKKSGVRKQNATNLARQQKQRQEKLKRGGTKAERDDARAAAERKQESGPVRVGPPKEVEEELADVAIGRCRGKDAKQCPGGKPAIGETQRCLEMFCSEGCVSLYHWPCWVSVKRDLADWKIEMGAPCITPDCTGTISQAHIKERNKISYRIVDEVKKEKGQDTLAAAAGNGRKKTKRHKALRKQADGDASTSGAAPQQGVGAVLDNPYRKVSRTFRGALPLKTEPKHEVAPPAPAPAAAADDGSAPAAPAKTPTLPADKSAQAEGKGGGAASLDKDKKPRAAAPSGTSGSQPAGGAEERQEPRNEEDLVLLVKDLGDESKEFFVKPKKVKSKAGREGKKTVSLHQFILPTEQEPGEDDMAAAEAQEPFMQRQWSPPRARPQQYEARRRAPPSPPRRPQPDMEFPPLAGEAERPPIASAHIWNAGAQAAPLAAPEGPDLVRLLGDSYVQKPVVQAVDPALHLLVENVDMRVDDYELLQLLTGGGNIVTEIRRFPSVSAIVASYETGREAQAALALLDSKILSMRRIRCPCLLVRQPPEDFFGELADDGAARPGSFLWGEQQLRQSLNAPLAAHWAAAGPPAPAPSRGEAAGARAGAAAAHRRAPENVEFPLPPAPPGAPDALSSRSSSGRDFPGGVGPGPNGAAGRKAAAEQRALPEKAAAAAPLTAFRIDAPPYVPPPAPEAPALPPLKIDALPYVPASLAATTPAARAGFPAPPALAPHASGDAAARERQARAEQDAHAASLNAHAPEFVARGSCLPHPRAAAAEEGGEEGEESRLLQDPARGQEWPAQWGDVPNPAAAAAAAGASSFSSFGSTGPVSSGISSLQGPGGGDSRVLPPPGIAAARPWKSLRYLFGLVLATDESTQPLYVQMGSFCLPSTMLRHVEAMGPAHCALFLLDVRSVQLHGYFDSRSGELPPVYNEVGELVMERRVEFELVTKFPVTLGPPCLEPCFPPGWLQAVPWDLPLYLPTHEVENLLELFEAKALSLSHAPPPLPPAPEEHQQRPPSGPPRESAAAPSRPQSSGGAIPRPATTPFEASPSAASSPSALAAPSLGETGGVSRRPVSPLGLASAAAEQPQLQVAAATSAEAASAAARFQEGGSRRPSSSPHIGSGHEEEGGALLGAGAVPGTGATPPLHRDGSAGTLASLNAPPTTTALRKDNPSPPAQAAAAAASWDSAAPESGAGSARAVEQQGGAKKEEASAAAAPADADADADLQALQAMLSRFGVAGAPPPPAVAPAAAAAAAAAPVAAGGLGAQKMGSGPAGSSRPLTPQAAAAAAGPATGPAEAAAERSGPPAPRETREAPASSSSRSEEDSDDMAALFPHLFPAKVGRQLVAPAPAPAAALSARTQQQQQQQHLRPQPATPMLQPAPAVPAGVPAYAPAAPTLHGPPPAYTPGVFPWVYTVTSGTAHRVREKPDRAAQVVGFLQPGHTVVAVMQQAQWLKLQVPGHLSCWSLAADEHNMYLRRDPFPGDINATIRATRLAGIESLPFARGAGGPASFHPASGAGMRPQPGYRPSTAGAGAPPPYMPQRPMLDPMRPTQAPGGAALAPPVAARPMQQQLYNPWPVSLPGAGAAGAPLPLYPAPPTPPSAPHTPPRTPPYAAPALYHEPAAGATLPISPAPAPAPAAAPPPAGSALPRQGPGVDAGRSAAEICHYCFKNSADFLLLACRHLGPCLECDKSKDSSRCARRDCGVQVTQRIRIYR